MQYIIDTLLTSEEPSVRFLTRTRVLGEDPESAPLCQLQQEIRSSDRIQKLLSRRDDYGYIPPFHHAYRKWGGAHWILVSLAEIGYPPGDLSLIPMRDQVYETWLNTKHLAGVSVINGRTRRCASQQGNALYASLALGLADERVERLVQLLLGWQWPDGGWNCDRSPDADTSSFWETLIPLRGLGLYARITGDAKVWAATERAADVFLKRRLFRRVCDGAIINEQFIRLHYPCYWRYDILFGLKVMAEVGFITDCRCNEALDLLVSKRLSDGGWPAEERFYRVTSEAASGSCSPVAWGPTGKRRMNEWVTADALFVLKAAGRLA